MTDGYDWEVIEALSEEIRQAIQRKKRRENERNGLQDAMRALYGPPPTPSELAEARSRIAAQAARDEGKGGLFE